MLQKIYDSFLTLAYPQICAVCEKGVESSLDGVVCSSCWKKTRYFSSAETACHKCQKFLTPKPSIAKTFCHKCDEHFYDLARSVGIYENALSASILRLKREPIIPSRLKKLIGDTFDKTPFGIADLIVPVPLSQTRFHKRGFNQAEVLAKLLSKNTGIRNNSEILLRTKHSKVHRAGMDKKARDMSVKKAFEVKIPEQVIGKNILLTDDVLTSGATVSHCAKTLKKAGAKCVYVFTIARAI